MTQPRIRDSHIRAALAKLNAAKGLEYPARGYSMFQDIRGDGRPHVRVYTVTNAAGGVTYAGELNGRTKRETLAKIQAVTP